MTKKIQSTVVPWKTVKYGNTRCVVNGVSFDSKMEAKRYGASKHDADRFVNEEIQRIFGINAIHLVTGGRNEQLRLRIVK